ncbi:MAG TPA: phage protein Gp36 family protein [Thermoanaerobaculia bacterium]|nr:phage protein Gp36 family protein [Thermoanaerobaculia bacterium]
MYPYDFKQEDLHERLTPARIDEITDGDDTRVEQAAIDTAGEIELYAGKYYVTPLAPFTAGLRTVFLDLWRWRLLFNCKPEWLNTDDKESEEYAIAQRRRRLESWLAGLSSDDRSTVLAGVVERGSGATSTGGAWSTGSRAVMTRASLLKL